LTGTNFQPSPTCNFDTDFGGTINTCTYVSATQITVNLTIASNATLGGHNVIVTNADGQSATFINGFTVAQDLGNTVKLGTGFTTGALVLNGNAKLNGSVLELTDGGMDEYSTGWYATRVNVQSFVNDFTFQLTPGTTADGFTFALQSNNTAAIGPKPGGGGLAYGPVLAGDPGGIPNSVAVKFDLFENTSEGINSTGLYINGASPTLPSIDLTPSGIDLHSGDTFAVHMTYDGTNLAMTLTDTVTSAVFTQTWPIDIPGTVGATTAYAGFTGASGGITATQNILTWTMAPPASAVTFTPTGPISFPDTTVDTTSTPISITVTNSSGASLLITGVSLTGTNPTDFTAPTNTCTNATLAVNGTCTVGVTFSPSGTGARLANLEIADAALGNPQTLALTGNGLAASSPAVTITPTSPIMFPSTVQGVASTPVTVTITNSGNATLNITTLTVTGTNAGDFALSANTCDGAGLAANATCTVAVTFTPGGTGTRTATLQAADNANGSPQSATLTGMGTAPAGPAVTITPTGPVTFPNTALNVTSAPITLTVTNTGSATLTITTAALSGVNAGDFALATNTCNGASVAVNATCSVSITFKPTVAGLRQAGLQISDNVVGSPQLVALSGSGNGATAPAVSLTPAGLTFAGTTQGTTSSPMNLTITNSGNAPLHVSSVAFAGTNVTEFVNPTSSCTAAIAPNGTCVVAVSFAPVSPASGTSHTETITITDDAANSPQTVNVSGTDNAAAFTVTSQASALTATVNAGQTGQYSVQLTPGAAYSGSVTMACSGAPATTTCTVANPIVLTAGTPTSFNVTVATTARSLLPLYPHSRPRPTGPYLIPGVLTILLAMLGAAYLIRARGSCNPRQLAYGGGVLILLLAAYGLAGCASGGSSSGGGGGGGTSGTQAGTYTLTLTPTANSTTGKPLQLTASQLTLKVN
jgi:hypothetical protein